MENLVMIIYLLGVFYLIATQSWFFIFLPFLWSPKTYKEKIG